MRHPWLPNAVVVHEIERKFWGGSRPEPGDSVTWVLFETDGSTDQRIVALHSGSQPALEWIVRDTSRFTG